MYDDILLLVDGSDAAERAATLGLALAARVDATVHALAVVERAVGPAGAVGDAADERHDRAVARGHEATNRVQELAGDVDVEVVRALREGVVHDAIVDYVDEVGVDLVAMATGSGDTGGGHLGTTTERVVGLVDVPVLAVPTTGGEEPSVGYGGFDEVLVATDGSDVAATAAAHGFALAERSGADVHVVYVVDADSTDLQAVPGSVVGLLKEGGETAVQALVEEAETRNLPVSTAVLRGTPSDAIHQYAAGADADLLVLGTRGLAASEDPFLGSTTARLLRRADVPVLVSN